MNSDNTVHNIMNDLLSTRIDDDDMEFRRKHFIADRLDSPVLFSINFV